MEGRKLSMAGPTWEDSHMKDAWRREKEYIKKLGGREKDSKGGGGLYSHAKGNSPVKNLI